MSLHPWLARCPLVAILRGITPEEAVPVAAALLEAGFAILEVPLNSPQPFDSIRRMAAFCGDRAPVGAGTVTRVEDVAALAGAGGRLMVTPHADPTLVRAAKAANPRLVVVLAGLPADPAQVEAYRQAGVDEFIHVRANVPGLLAQLLKTIGAVA